VRLHDGGREYAHFAWWGATPTDPPPDVTTTGDPTTWTPTTWWAGTGPVWDEALTELGVTQADVDTGRARICRVPFATPGAPTSGDPALAVPAGRVTGVARLTSGDEVILRDWTESVLVTS
jgi:hypothetical protein